MATANSTTYTKLKDGTWGLRVPGTIAVTEGSSVTVTKRDGSTRAETIARVLWSGQDKDGRFVRLCSIAQQRAGRVYDPHKFNGYGARKGGYRKACVTGGNCSSVGSGRSCGGYDCDGY